MFFDLFLAGIFFASATALWYRISLKIPEMVAVSDAVIVERLHEDSAKIRIFLLHFKTFYREGRHWIWLWKFSEKICHRAHIFLLRADNAVVATLRKIRSAGNGTSIAAGNGGADLGVPRSALSNNTEYWFKLRYGREIKGAETSHDGHSPTAAPRPRMGRIQEVRARKKEKTPE